MQEHSKGTYAEGNESFVLPRVPNQHGQEHYVPFTAARISWFQTEIHAA